MTPGATNNAAIAALLFRKLRRESGLFASGALLLFLLTRFNLV
jgi:hypothetical protein